MEKIEIKVPKYNPDEGFTYIWENGFDIETQVGNGIIKIIANKAGLISLANHFLNLAQDEIPVGYHLHLDENNALDEDSTELIIEKKL